MRENAESQLRQRVLVSLNRQNTGWILIGFIACAAFFSVYRLTDREIMVVDVKAVMRVPVSLITEGDLYLDEYKSKLRPKILPDHDGKTVSMFPIWPAMQLMPVYLAATALGHPPSEKNVEVLQRRSAQLNMALTAALLLVLLGHKYSLRVTIMVALAFGLGSINWFLLSQISFSNGFIQLWIVIGLISGLWERTPSKIGGAISLMCFTVAVFYRLNFLPVAAIWAVYLVVRTGKRAVTPILVALALFVTMGIANQAYDGNFLGFYASMARHLSFPAPTLGLALYGNLLSPARGLLVFSPWVVFAFLAPFVAAKQRRLTILVLFAGCLGHLLLTSSHWNWPGGGGSMGPRLTADLLPIWALLAAETISVVFRKTHLWAIPALVIGLSIFIAGGHSRVDTRQWNTEPVPLAEATVDRIFDWRDALVAFPFQKSPLEQRYRIKTLAPIHNETVVGSSVEFRWNVTASKDVRSNLRILVWPEAKTRRRISELVFEDLSQPRLVLPWQQVKAANSDPAFLAWRIETVDHAGRQSGRSPWRKFIWTPISRAHNSQEKPRRPCETSTLLFGGDFESGMGWSSVHP